MARPKQPQLARTAEAGIDPDHVETGLQGQPPPTTGGETGPIPADNQPGHHPAKEQDKPDLDAFAAKLGADPKAPSTTRARKPARPKAAPPNTAPTGTAPPRAEQPAAAPVWPEAAPAAAELGPRPDAAGFPAPQPSTDSPQEREPFMVALAMLPLRETVKRLERLERTLSGRLMARAGRGPRGR